MRGLCSHHMCVVPHNGACVLVCISESLICSVKCILLLLAGERKDGNDGSLSCYDYCTSNIFGNTSYATCTAAYDPVKRTYIPCSRMKKTRNAVMPTACHCSKRKPGYIPGVCSVPASNVQPLQNSGEGESQGLGCDRHSTSVLYRLYCADRLFTSEL